jgi:hypothetical protein
MEKISGYRPKGAVFSIALSSAFMVIKALFHTRLGLLLPLVLVLLFLAMILGILSLVSPIAPFIYPLF